MKSLLTRSVTPLAALLLAIGAARGQSVQPVYARPYFQQEADFRIHVTLDDTDNTLDGFESIEYLNNSPDTLHFIWFHLWPNAYKNDRTAFSEQMLRLGNTSFYFSDEASRGYINRLDFKVNGIRALAVDSAGYIDMTKLLLPRPLLPGDSARITTPFHEKIPRNFSRGGHEGHSYQITQWYPKPAVYDRDGWHPMPYLEQGEYYSEFGRYEVQITLPRNYVVAATGELQNEDELNFLHELASQPVEPAFRKKPATVRPLRSGRGTPRRKAAPARPSAGDDFYVTRETEATKTLLYVQDSVHDFAWFADRNFVVNEDTLQLPSGRVIHVYAFYSPAHRQLWKNSIGYIKSAVRTRSGWLGEYPYNVVSAVQADLGFDGGMEYPTITSISGASGEQDLDLVIEHEVGHNWNYGVLATNERDHPWMDEGINTYFDNRYRQLKYGNVSSTPRTGDFLEDKIPADKSDLGYRTILSEKRDQPIEGTSDAFSPLNYELIVYDKTARWMKLLEQYTGQPLFDSCLHAYYDRWKFKHPAPADLQAVFREVSGKNTDSVFQLLGKKGPLEPAPRKDIRLSAFFNFNGTDRHHYVFLAPAAGFNYYDRLMVGGLVHNYTLPLPHLHFVLAPLYATGSDRLAGLGRIGFNILRYGWIRKTEISLSGESFSMDAFTDSTGHKNYLGFRKLVPSVKLTFRNRTPVSTVTRSLQWKTFLISETQLRFMSDTTPPYTVITYPVTRRYLNQLSFRIDNSRVLYPYGGTLQVQQARDFIRLDAVGNYFFNYAKGGGLSVRLFAGKFLYLGDRTLQKEFETDRFHLNMTGANGNEDYTYSNYFLGRNEFQGLSSQQIMMRDGAFKVRSDLLASKIGKTDDWLTAANFVTDLPGRFNPLAVLPLKIPLKVFADIGTYAEAWKQNPPTGRFLYDGGFQLSLFRDLVKIYVPVVYSKVYADYFKSTITGNRFLKNISFSIDIQHFNFYKFFDLPDL